MQSRKGLKGSQNRTRRGKTDIPLDTFVELLYEEGGSAYRVGQRTGLAVTNLTHRRKWVEEQLQITLPRGRPEVWVERHNAQHIDLQIDDGVMIVGSDLHAWPEVYGTAMAAYVDFHRRLKPQWSVLNGDGLDGAKISRHPPNGHELRPEVHEEIDALRDFLEEVRAASPDTKRKRTRGNHDTRFDRYFASEAAAMTGVRGTALSDHIPGWDEVMTITVNGNCIIQHRYRSGTHAIWNNVREFGCHVITGHRHSQEVKPWTNKLGTWYGVDSGVLAPVDHPAFAYTEQRRTTNWRSGFVVLTWKSGNLMPPELVQVTDEERGEVYFRGQTLRYEL